MCKQYSVGKHCAHSFCHVFFFFVYTYDYILSAYLNVHDEIFKRFFSARFDNFEVPNPGYEFFKYTIKLI